MSTIVRVNYIASPTSVTETRFVEGGRSIQEYLEDVEGLSSTKNVAVEVDGEEADMYEEIYDGMTICISQLKTASGRVI